MTDKRIKMECPFCHTGKEHIQIRPVAKGLVYLTCPGCGCTFKGSSKEEVIGKWNCR